MEYADIVQWRPPMTLHEMNAQVIVKCIKVMRGNKIRAAASLGITERTINNWLVRIKNDENLKYLSNDLLIAGRGNIESHLASDQNAEIGLGQA